MAKIVSNDDLFVIISNLNKRSWIIENPQCEIESYYPLADEIRINEITGVCTKDIDAFKIKCL